MQLPGCKPITLVHMVHACVVLRAVLLVRAGPMLLHVERCTAIEALTCGHVVCIRIPAGCNVAVWHVLMRVLCISRVTLPVTCYAASAVPRRHMQAPLAVLYCRDVVRGTICAQSPAHGFFCIWCMHWLGISAWHLDLCFGCGLLRPTSGPAHAARHSSTRSCMQLCAQEPCRCCGTTTCGTCCQQSY